MKRLLMVCALAGLAVACGDDDGDKGTTKTDGGFDSGVKPDAGGTDSGVGADTGAAAAKVTNVGTACTVATQATACTGAAAICQTTTFSQAAIPGGSCSAVCSSNAECGPNGNCATGVAIKNFGAQATATLGTTGYCTKSCAALGATTCGTGFSCLSLNELSKLSGRMPTTIAPLDDTFCFPTPVAPTDAGVGDGGTALRLDGGLDAGR
ncbi:MAG: hypothetical protein RLZZ450_7738 [Pseudomonadota bacterium]